jgi:phosphoribosylanthranilate isomerase
LGDTADNPVDRVWIKICGIRRPADVMVAAEEGADAVGLVFDESSTRCVSLDEARLLVSVAGSDILCVGVFRNLPAASVAQVVDEVGLEAVQYYGDPSEFSMIRTALPHLRFASYSLSLAGNDSEGVVGDVLARFERPETRPDVLLFDSSSPGSGKRWNWSVLSGYFGPIPFVLAGGLDADNVGDAIAAVRPWGVDVSSSLEVRPGVKDPASIRRFVAAVRRATTIRDTVGARAERLYGTS